MAGPAARASCGTVGVDEAVEGEGEVVHVAVDHVEAAGAPEHPAQHPEVVGGGLLRAGPGATQALADDGSERGAGLRVAGGERVTLCPRRTSSSVRYETTRSVPP